MPEVVALRLAMLCLWQLTVVHSLQSRPYCDASPDLFQTVRVQGYLAGDAMGETDIAPHHGCAIANAFCAGTRWRCSATSASCPVLCLDLTCAPLLAPPTLTSVLSGIQFTGMCVGPSQSRTMCCTYSCSAKKATPLTMLPHSSPTTCPS